MKIKYSKEGFDGYTHRFVVRFIIDDDFRNDRVIDVYSNSGDRLELDKFINEKKSDKVKSFVLEHIATKEADEAASIMIIELLND